MVHFKHTNITNPSLTHANKIMKAIANLANIFKHKPIVTAEQEQEIWDLQRLVVNTHMSAPLLRVTKQQDKPALPKVQTEAILPRVQTNEKLLTVPEATQDERRQTTQQWRQNQQLPIYPLQQTIKQHVAANKLWT